MHLKLSVKMALIKSVRGFTPQTGKNVFLAENATIIGDVIIGDDISIGHNVSIKSILRINSE